MYHKIVSNFSSVSGVYDKFVKDYIRENPYISPASITRAYQNLCSEDLRKSFFKEIHLYLDKSLYQYIISKKLLNTGDFSWGAVTQYYANFFSISGLIRLQEHGFSRIGNKNIEIINESDNTYKIREIKVNGLHRIVWNKYFSLYQGFDYKPHIFHAVYSPIEVDNFYYESDRRNDINYDPGAGYWEIYSSKSTIQKRKKELLRDTYPNVNFVRINKWIDLENITQYRIRLLANIISEIDKHSDFPTQTKERLTTRKKIIINYEKSKKYRDRFIGWLEGE